MRIGDRVLLIVAMLLCIAACGYLFAILWGLLPLQGLVQVLYSLADAWYYRIGVTAVLVLFCMGFIKLMFVRGGSQRFMQENIPINESGDVRISAEAVRQMCEQIAKSDLRIETAGCAVYRQNKEIVVEIKAHCKSEQYIPSIAETLQAQILQTLKEICGIANAKVRVLVEKADVSAIPKASPAVAVTAVKPAAEQPAVVSVAKPPVEQPAVQNNESEPADTNGGQANG